MKTKLLHLFTLCFIALIGFSQSQQQIWYLNNQSIDFRVFPPVLNAGLPGSTGASIFESRNGVHNQNGDLLFFVVDGNQNKNA